jgi:hypothetical protein
MDHGQLKRSSLSICWAIARSCSKRGQKRTRVVPRSKQSRKSKTRLGCQVPWLSVCVERCGWLSGMLPLCLSLEASCTPSFLSLLRSILLYSTERMNRELGAIQGPIDDWRQLTPLTQSMPLFGVLLCLDSRDRPRLCTSITSWFRLIKTNIGTQDKTCKTKTTWDTTPRLLFSTTYFPWISDNKPHSVDWSC